jgi:hypothetical protein
MFRVWNDVAVEVVHNMKASGVTVSDWHDFADGNQICLQVRASSRLHVRDILERVEANTGKPYHLFAQNCEHFASFAFTGKAESKSIQVIGWGAAVAIALPFFGRR